MLGSKEDFSWDTVAQNDAIGKLVGGYLNEMLMSDEQKEARAADEQKRQQEQGGTAQGFKFMNMFENTIGGFFSRLGEDMNALASDVGNAASGVKSAWGSIKSGEAWENIKTGAASAWEGVKGAASWVKDTAVSAWNGMKDAAVTAWSGVTGAVSSAVGAVSTFAQKTGNWFTGDGFNTDDEVVDIKLARYQELINNPILMASNGGESQAEMFAWKSASERANEMSQIAEKITPQQLEYAILRSGMSKEDADKLRQMYSLDRGSDIESDEVRTKSEVMVASPNAKDMQKFKETEEMYKVQTPVEVTVDGVKTRYGTDIEPGVIFPLSGTIKDIAAKVTSLFGVEREYTNTNGEKKEDVHKGSDFGLKKGEPIYAPADGKVSFVEDYGKKFYGKLTIIDHGDGLETRYGHQSEILVQMGQDIKRGELIGRTGNTGNTTAPHLHYEIRKKGKPQDPLKYIFGR